MFFPLHLELSTQALFVEKIHLIDFQRVMLFIHIVWKTQARNSHVRHYFRAYKSHT